MQYFIITTKTANKHYCKIDLIYCFTDIKNYATQNPFQPELCCSR